MLLFLLLKIFFARIIDVSLGTYKTLLTVKGKMVLPTIVAFIEIMIWFYVAREALVTNENSCLIPIAYASGYAIGGLIGSIISNKLISCVTEVKVYHFNKKVLSYLDKNNIHYFHIENHLLVFYLTMNHDENHIKEIHNMSKKSIVYTKEVKLEKFRKQKSIMNYLQ